MTKKIDILGIQLNDYTVREAILKVEAFPDDNVPKAIESISMKMLMEAENDAELKEVLTSLDVPVIGEKEILEIAGVNNMQRIKETKERDFFVEFFKRMERNRRRIFLLGETEEKINAIKQQLFAEYPRLQFAGEYALEKCVGDLDAAVNEVNAATPDVVVSVLPTPAQERFFGAHRDKINAKIWYGLGEFDVVKKPGMKKNFRNLIHWRRLKISVEKYEKKMEETKSSE